MRYAVVTALLGMLRSLRVRKAAHTAHMKEDAMSPEQVQSAFADYIAHLNSLKPAQMIASYAENPLGNAARRDLFESLASVFRALVWEPENVYIDGNTVANKWTATGTTPAGKVVTFDGIAVLTFNEAGKVVTQHTYWYPETIVEQLDQ
jgi:ketosteroid isomerase-like protein